MEIQQDKCDVAKMICDARQHFKSLRRMIGVAYWVGLIAAGLLFLLGIRIVWFLFSNVRG